MFGRVRPGRQCLRGGGGGYSSDEMLVGGSQRQQARPCRCCSPAIARTSIRWLIRFVGNERVAEDLLSDVFFDVWQQADRFEGRSAVSTWRLYFEMFLGVLRTPAPDHTELDEVIEATLSELRRQRRGCSGEKAAGRFAAGDALTELFANAAR